MRFCTKQHESYCGIDLHGKTMYVCALDAGGTVVEHCNIATKADELLRLITPFHGDIVVGVECTFSWYRVADLCAEKWAHDPLRLDLDCTHDEAADFLATRRQATDVLREAARREAATGEPVDYTAMERFEEDEEE